MSPISCAPPALIHSLNSLPVSHLRAPWCCYCATNTDLGSIDPRPLRGWSGTVFRAETRRIPVVLVICCCETSNSNSFFSRSVWVDWAQLGSYSAPYAVRWVCSGSCFQLGTRLELVSPRWEPTLRGHVHMALILQEFLLDFLTAQWLGSVKGEAARSLMVLEVSELHFRCILLVEASHRNSPDSKRKEIGLVCSGTGGIVGGRIWRLSPCLVTPSTLLPVSSRVCYLYFGISESPMKLIPSFHPPG